MGVRPIYPRLAVYDSYSTRFVVDMSVILVLGGKWWCVISGDQRRGGGVYS